MKLYIRFAFIVILMMFMWYWFYVLSEEVRSPTSTDFREKRAHLQPVNIFHSNTWETMISGSIALWELHPIVTWYVTFSGYLSIQSEDQILLYRGLVNQKDCSISVQDVATWIKLKVSGCHNIRNKEDWRMLMYMQNAIDSKDSQWRIITYDKKQFIFFLYPWGILNSISNVVSAEHWKCTIRKCTLFIDKDLLHDTWSNVPLYVSHEADLEIGNNGNLEIHDRSIDDGLLDWYVWNDEFELVYKRWWLFKRLLYVKWSMNASDYSLLFTIGKWLRREMAFNRCWGTLSGSLVSSGGTNVLIW